jgi:cysteinyl-tRNA synthetase
VPGVDGLPPGADALLTAREKNSDDADELRAELARLGVVVRDEKGKQYWRPAG